VSEDNNFGVILTKDGWSALDSVLKPLIQTGTIGKFLYCKSFALEGPFAVLGFVPAQASGQIAGPTDVWVPAGFVLVVVESPKDARAFGFSHPDKA
jgi:hypothetical protein